MTSTHYHPPPFPLPSREGGSKPSPLAGEGRVRGDDWNEAVVCSSAYWGGRVRTQPEGQKAVTILIQCLAVAFHADRNRDHGKECYWPDFREDVVQTIAFE